LPELVIAAYGRPMKRRSATRASVSVLLFIVGCGSSPLRGRGDSDLPGADTAATDGDASGGDPGGCRLTASSDASFDASTPLSDEANGAYSPTIGVLGGDVLVAWHEFFDSRRQVVYSVIHDDCVGPRQLIPDSAPESLHAAVVGTTSGFVIFYEAPSANGTPLRAVWLDARGALVAGPETITAAGASGGMPRIAAAGDDVAFAWTDGAHHFYALRGPTENLAAVAVGTTLLSGGLINFPRVARAVDGTTFIAYRDGGTDSTDWDVMLVSRPTGGVFGAPVNVSNTPGMLSDDIDLAIEGNGNLDVVWVDQDPGNIYDFEVFFTTRSPAGVIATPTRVQTLGTLSWGPSVAPGPYFFWNVGASGFGELYFASGVGMAAPVFAGQTGNLGDLVRDDFGRLHIVFMDHATPPRIQYAWRP